MTVKLIPNKRADGTRIDTIFVNLDGDNLPKVLFYPVEGICRFFEQLAWHHSIYGEVTDSESLACTPPSTKSLVPPPPDKCGIEPCASCLAAEAKSRREYADKVTLILDDKAITEAVNAMAKTMDKSIQEALDMKKTKAQVTVLTTETVKIQVGSEGIGQVNITIDNPDSPVPDIEITIPHWSPVSDITCTDLEIGKELIDPLILALEAAKKAVGG
jgi:hypothetical protein